MRLLYNSELQQRRILNICKVNIALIYACQALTPLMRKKVITTSMSTLTSLQQTFASIHRSSRIFFLMLAFLELCRQCGADRKQCDILEPSVC